MSHVNANSKAINFLIIERDTASFRALAQGLNAEFGNKCALSRTECGRQAAQLLRQNAYDVVLTDTLSLGDFSGALDESIAKICRLAGSALIIAISNGGSVSSAVDAMRSGAHDYLPKPINTKALASHIEELGRRHGHVIALSSPQHTTDHNSRTAQFEGFVGASAQMQAIYTQIERIAPSSAPVFITGESGTGKEVCAQALHQRSPRADSPFIAINCSAIPRELMEGEIFGVVRGAYTGADKDRTGAAEMAEGGVLFLDEIGELDLSLQAKLLRFLQTGEVSRVGEAKSKSVDVRVICATNRNPMELIAEKKFREDLFYRLHVLPIHLPPLRQRTGDILPLAQTFLTRYAREENKQFSGFSEQTSQLIMARRWHGNVRQLQNLIRRVVVMFDGPEVSAQMFESADIESQHSNNKIPARTVNQLETLQGSIKPMWQQEQCIIETALARYNGNIALAAAALEISPSTIYRKKQAWEQKTREQKTRDQKTWEQKTWEQKTWEQKTWDQKTAVAFVA